MSATGLASIGETGGITGRSIRTFSRSGLTFLQRERGITHGYRSCTSVPTDSVLSSYDKPTSYHHRRGSGPSGRSHRLGRYPQYRQQDVGENGAFRRNAVQQRIGGPSRRVGGLEALS